ncbi:amidohydrolase family protein [Streptomyces chrestomyceticus]|uniref:amidohydrolase family protein n=1 Tax=Streptomyces chrestomyceticus TaxID=68185 RepID=UPI00379435FB
MKPYDTLIQGGTVIDGRRNPRYRADVAVKEGRIAAIGRLNPSDAEEVLDAEGHIVAPGFVDLHTHYDAQLFWDPYCTISGYHGVTSVVIGNCGYGFAPVRAGLREQAMQALTRVEQIPYEAMKSSLPWSWETFPEFLDALDATPKGVNVLPYIGASPLLNYVMGPKAAKSRAATPQENAEMARIFEEALQAGACGWSAMRTPPDSFSSVHRDADGTSFPADLMSNDTAFALAAVMARRNTGFMQMTMVSNDQAADMAHLEELARASRRPIVWNALLVDGEHPELHRQVQAWFDSCRQRGLSLYCQGMTTDVSMLFNLEVWNLWDANPDWQQALMGNRAERAAKLRDPEVRRALRQDQPVLYPLRLVELHRTGLSDYQRFAGHKLPDIAAALGSDPVDTLLDISLAEDLQTTWKVPLFQQDDDLMREVVQDPWVLPGVSDGSAHTKMLTSGRYPTEHIEEYVRERGWIPLEDMHWKLSAYPAWVAGFKDRGTLSEGAPADVVVYDFDGLRCLPDEVVHDVPGGDWRRIRRAEGYRYILVNGRVTFHDGKCTGATPGALLRHGHHSKASPS